MNIFMIDLSRRDGEGTCEQCGHVFVYYLVHNGFNDSAYAYCDACGSTALFSAWYAEVPKIAELRFHEPIAPEVETFVRPCRCGGSFRGTASPRCPRCREPLSAEHAAEYLERNAPGTRAGWRWQRTWSGLYAIVIEDRMTSDPWAQRGPK